MHIYFQNVGNSTLGHIYPIFLPILCILQGLGLKTILTPIATLHHMHLILYKCGISMWVESKLPTLQYST